MGFRAVAHFHCRREDLRWVVGEGLYFPTCLRVYLPLVLEYVDDEKRDPPVLVMKEQWEEVVLDLPRE